MVPSRNTNDTHLPTKSFFSYEQTRNPPENLKMALSKVVNGSNKVFNSLQSAYEHGLGIYDKAKSMLRNEFREKKNISLVSCLSIEPLQKGMEYRIGEVKMKITDRMPEMLTRFLNKLTGPTYAAIVYSGKCVFVYYIRKMSEDQVRIWLSPLQTDTQNNVPEIANGITKKNMKLTGEQATMFNNVQREGTIIGNIKVLNDMLFPEKMSDDIFGDFDNDDENDKLFKQLVKA